MLLHENDSDIGKLNSYGNCIENAKSALYNR